MLFLLLSFFEKRGKSNCKTNGGLPVGSAIGALIEGELIEDTVCVRIKGCQTA